MRGYAHSLYFLHAVDIYFALLSTLNVKGIKQVDQPIIY